MGVPLDTEPAAAFLEGVAIVPSAYESIRKMEAIPSLSKIISDAQSVRWGMSNDRSVLVLKGYIEDRTGFFVGIFSADRKRVIVAQHMCYTHPIHISYDWSRFLITMLANSSNPFSKKNAEARSVLDKLSRWREEHYDVSRLKAYPPKSGSEVCS